MKHLYKYVLLGLIINALNTSVQAMKYEDGQHIRAFEDSAPYTLCKRLLLCEPVNRGRHTYTMPVTRDVEVGHSIGPHGRTTHYEKRTTIEGHVSPDFWVCAKCGRYLNTAFGMPTAPVVRFWWEDNGSTRVMGINEWYTSSPCSKGFNYAPYINDKDETLKTLREIWWNTPERRSSSWITLLTSMWETARRRDSKDTHILPFEDFTFSLDTGPLERTDHLEETSQKPEKQIKFKVKNESLCSIS